MPLLFITLNILCQSLWPAQFLLKKQLTILWELPYRSLTTLLLLIFKILSMPLHFDILIMMYVCVSLCGLLFGTLRASWICISIYFTRLGKFSVIIFSSKIWISFSLSLLTAPSWCQCWSTWRCPRGYLSYPHLGVSFLFLLFWLAIFCFLIFQISDVILCFIFDTVYSQ